MAKHQITQSKLEKLKIEYSNLINVERPKVIQEIQEARALGDLSENADYDAAKNQQRFIEGKIEEIGDIISNHELIDESVGGSIVSIGSKVTLLNVTGNFEVEYEILGTIDNDPVNNKISNECPLAKAILGKAVGDVIEIIEIQDPYTVKVLKIS